MTDELYTTLRLLRPPHACHPRRYHALLQALGGDRLYGADRPIPVWRVLEITGHDDIVWVLRVVPREQTALCSRLVRLHACDCAAETPVDGGRRIASDLLTDERSRQAVRLSQLATWGKASADELRQAWCASWAAWAEGYRHDSPEEAAARAAAWAAADNILDALAEVHEWSAKAALRLRGKGAWDTARAWHVTNLHQWLRTRFVEERDTLLLSDAR